MSRRTSAGAGSPMGGEASNDLYRELFESTRQPLAIARVLCGDRAAEPSDLNFLDVNAAFKEQAGFGDARGTRVREAPLPAEQLDRWVRACGQAAMTGIPQSFEHHFGGRNFNVSTFRIGQEDQRSVAIVLEDVTPMEQAKIDLRRQRDLLQSIDEVLVATKMQISLTKSAVRDPGSRKLLDKASRLIDDSIGRSRSLGSELSPAVQYESGLIPALRQFAAWIAGRYQMRVTVQSNTDLKPQNQDAAVALFAVTRELLFNVAKHAQVKEARVTLTERHGQIELCVEDTGVGFDPGAPHPGVKRGAGLTKARERLRRIGGDLKVESQLGQGTRVTVIAPASTAERPEAGTVLEPVDAAQIITRLGAEAEGPKERAIRVLLVDDHQVLREGLASLLEAEEGIEVVGQAADGYEAIELARRLRPDVTTMDISMPRMNGIEATRQIKSEMPDIRIIGLSMHGEQEQA
ncbi:MAG: response regulator, partial [Acidobacteria bacterium]